MKLIEVAKSQIGISEQPPGSNDGPQIKQFLASVGIYSPAAWCAAFVVWCHLQAKINSIPRTGGVLDLWNKSPDNRTVTPQPGDVMILDYGNGQGHTGIIIEVNGDTLTTIEGNTNDDGSREGYEVARRTRQASKCKGFLHFE